MGGGPVGHPQGAQVKTLIFNIKYLPKVSHDKPRKLYWAASPPKVAVGTRAWLSVAVSGKVLPSQGPRSSLPIFWSLVPPGIRALIGPSRTLLA